uniref:Putative chemosensory protein 5 n=1 Tax=Ectropis obliqua TaxID=248899 RepID=A0A1W5LB26_ECTOB|nr:putative chemosensory protein 5 [Ectropis obliqua]
MKTVLVFCVIVGAALCAPQEHYSTQYDNFDAQELAQNPRLLKNYAKCFLSQGPCTSEGTDFKKVIPDAVKTKCEKCSDKQKELIRIVVKAMQEKLPELWQELVKKEDPNGQYKGAFEAFIKGN